MPHARKPEIIQFLSTPSGWRATVFGVAHLIDWHISIPALRVEGDDYTVQGITLQAEKRKPDVAKTYSDLAGTASGAYYDATQKTKELYAQTVHSYNTYAVGGGVGGTVQLDRIADKLDELTRVTEGSKIDEGEFADKLGTAMEKVNIKAEAVISSRRVAAEIASDMDKEQGETLAMRDRGVI